jgi:hypothetical protein
MDEQQAEEPGRHTRVVRDDERLTITLEALGRGRRVRTRARSRTDRRRMAEVVDLMQDVANAGVRAVPTELAFSEEDGEVVGEGGFPVRVGQGRHAEPTSSRRDFGKRPRTSSTRSTSGDGSWGSRTVRDSVCGPMGAWCCWTWVG